MILKSFYIRPHPGSFFYSPLSTDMSSRRDGLRTSEISYINWLLYVTSPMSIFIPYYLQIYHPAGMNFYLSSFFTEALSTTGMSLRPRRCRINLFSLYDISDICFTSKSATKFEGNLATFIMPLNKVWKA